MSSNKNIIITEDIARKIHRQKLPEGYDRRAKLSDEQRDEIRHKYSTGLYSQRQLAAEYGVSRRLIIFILDPDKRKRNAEVHRENGSDGRYRNTEEENEMYRERPTKYKEQLFIEGKLVLD